LDVIGTSTVGYDFATLRNPEISIVETFLAILEPTWEKITYLAIRLMLPDSFVRCLPWNLNKVMDGNRKPLQKKILEIIQQKRQVLVTSTRKPGDFDGDILRTIMQGGEFADDNLVDQVMTLLAAGVCFFPSL
jgi:cytochrome P450